MECGLTTKQLITAFIFLKDKVQKADLIIVPGSSHPQLPQKAVLLYQKDYANKILFTGGFNPKSGKNDCDFGKEIALSAGVPHQDIYCENKSTNTKENASEAIKLIKSKKLKHKKILLVCKPYHARRLQMTFKRFFPKSELLFIPTVDKWKITKYNWWKSKEKADMVMDEVRKIGEYFIKGDLNLN